MSARQFLTGGQVLTEDGLASGLGVLIEGGTILDLLPETSGVDLRSHCCSINLRPRSVIVSTTDSWRESCRDGVFHKTLPDSFF